MNENKNPWIKIYFLSRSHLPSRTAHVVDLEAHQRNGVTLMLMIFRLLIIIFIIVGVVVGGCAGWRLGEFQDFLEVPDCSGIGVGG